MKRSTIELVGVIVAILTIAGLIGIAFTEIAADEKATAAEKVRETQENEKIAAEKAKWKAYFDEKYEESEKPIYGTVLEEKSGMQTIPGTKTVHGSGGYTGPFGGYHPVSTSERVATERADSVYVIKVRIDAYTAEPNISVPSKIVAINVVNGGITKETLEALIEQGSRIEFKRGNMRKGNPQESSFSELDNMILYGYYGTPGSDWFSPETQGLSKPAGSIKVLDPNF